MTPATEGSCTDGKVVPYDGSALCVLRRLLRVLDKTTDYESKLVGVKGRFEALLVREAWR